MIIVVTGASGHIGGVLCRQLISLGHDVRVLVHTDDRAVKDLPVEAFRGDVRDRQSLVPLVHDAQWVFHLAAKITIEGDRDGTVWSTNVDGVRNVAEACLDAGVDRLVHVSSIHAFDQQPFDQVLDETRMRVGNDAFVYDRSKWAGERELQKVIDRGLDAVIVNPTAVIGPFDFKPSRMGEVFLKLGRRRMAALVNGGFDWVDVRDVAQSTISAATTGTRGHNYLLSGRWLSLQDVAQTASQVVGVKAPSLTLPVGVARLGLPFVRIGVRLTNTRPAYTRESLEIVRNSNRFVSSARARSTLDHNARPMEDSVTDIYRWFSEDGRDEVSVR